MKTNFILYQKVKITIEKVEQVKITESGRGNKKKENPFSRDCVFLAVSLHGEFIIDRVEIELNIKLLKIHQFIFYGEFQEFYILIQSQLFTE